MTRFLWIMVVPLLTVIFVCEVMILGGANWRYVFAVSQLGTLTVLIGTILYHVFVSTNTRWPGVPAWIRWARVMTFYRG